MFYKYDTQRNEIILCYVKTFVGSPRNSDYQCVRTTRCRYGGRSGVSVGCIALNNGFEIETKRKADDTLTRGRGGEALDLKIE